MYDANLTTSGETPSGELFSGPDALLNAAADPLPISSLDSLSSPVSFTTPPARRSLDPMPISSPDSISTSESLRVANVFASQEMPALSVLVSDDRSESNPSDGAAMESDPVPALESDVAASSESVMGVHVMSTPETAAQPPADSSLGFDAGLPPNSAPTAGLFFFFSSFFLITQ